MSSVTIVQWPDRRPTTWKQPSPLMNLTEDIQVNEWVSFKTYVIRIQILWRSWLYILKSHFSFEQMGKRSSHPWGKQTVRPWAKSVAKTATGMLFWLFGSFVNFSLFSRNYSFQDFKDSLLFKAELSQSSQNSNAWMSGSFPPFFSLSNTP